MVAVDQRVDERRALIVDALDAERAQDRSLDADAGVAVDVALHVVGDVAASSRQRATLRASMGTVAIVRGICHGKDRARKHANRYAARPRAARARATRSFFSDATSGAAQATRAAPAKKASAPAARTSDHASAGVSSRASDARRTSGDACTSDAASPRATIGAPAAFPVVAAFAGGDAGVTYAAPPAPFAYAAPPAPFAYAAPPAPTRAIPSSAIATHAPVATRGALVAVAALRIAPHAAIAVRSSPRASASFAIERESLVGDARRARARRGALGGVVGARDRRRDVPLRERRVARVERARPEARLAPREERDDGRDEQRKGRDRAHRDCRPRVRHWKSRFRKTIALSVRSSVA